MQSLRSGVRDCLQSRSNFTLSFSSITVNRSALAGKDLRKSQPRRRGVRRGKTIEPHPTSYAVLVEAQLSNRSEPLFLQCLSLGIGSSPETEGLQLRRSGKPSAKACAVQEN
jgi:hypothetical protein